MAGIYGDAFYYNSDIKLKENVETIDNALEIVHNLRGVTYDLIEDGQSYVGFIAQEVEDIVPQLVDYNEETDNKVVNYAQTVAILVQAMKEIDAKYQAEIESLKNEIEELKSK